MGCAVGIKACALVKPLHVFRPNYADFLPNFKFYTNFTAATILFILPYITSAQFCPKSGHNFIPNRFQKLTLRRHTYLLSTRKGVSPRLDENVPIYCGFKLLSVIPLLDPLPTRNYKNTLNPLQIMRTAYVNVTLLLKL